MQPGANPFKLVLDTAYGPVCVGVGPCHVATLASPVDPATLKVVPLVVDDVEVAVDGTATRGMDGWDFSGTKAYALSGAALPISGWQGVVLSLDSVLCEHERRFVEADLTRIVAMRRKRDAQIEAVQEEISRRQRKLEQLQAERAAQEEMLVPREAALRGLLSDLRADALQGAGAREGL